MQPQSFCFIACTKPAPFMCRNEQIKGMYVEWSLCVDFHQLKSYVGAHFSLKEGQLWIEHKVGQYCISWLQASMVVCLSSLQLPNCMLYSQFQIGWIAIWLHGAISFPACHYVTPTVQYCHLLWCHAICHLPVWQPFWLAVRMAVRVAIYGMPDSPLFPLLTFVSLYSVPLSLSHFSVSLSLPLSPSPVTVPFL